MDFSKSYKISLAIRGIKEKRKMKISDKPFYGGIAWFLIKQKEKSKRDLEKERNNAN